MARTLSLWTLKPEAFASPTNRFLPNRRIVAQALLLRALGKRQSRHSVANIRDADLRSSDFASRRSRHDANMMQQPNLERSQGASNVFRRFVHGPQTPNYHLGRHQRGLFGIHANGYQ
jgi:hypothetical protein